MKRVLASVVILSASLSLAAQTSKSAPAATPKAAHKTSKSKAAKAAQAGAPQVTPRELEESLDQLQRVVDSTNNDISSLQVDKWGSSKWKNPLHRGSSAHKEQAAKLAESLQRNLSTALPELVHEAQVTHGAFAPTFKLYDNVNVVYELMDSLVDLTNKSGKKQEYQMLAYDFNSLGQVRRTLSNYMEQAAVALDKHKPLGSTASLTSTDRASGGPIKIIVDDNVPARPARRSAVVAAAPAPAAKTAAPAKVSSPIEDSFVSNLSAPAPAAKPAAVKTQPAPVVQPRASAQTAPSVRPEPKTVTPAAAAVPVKVVTGNVTPAAEAQVSEQPKLVLTEVRTSVAAAAPTPAAAPVAKSTETSQPAAASPGSQSGDPFATLPRPAAKTEHDPFADLPRTSATEPPTAVTAATTTSASSPAQPVVTPVAATAAAPKAAAKAATDDTTQPPAAKKPKIVIEN